MPAKAQELNAKITINRSQIQGTDASVFDELQKQLEQHRVVFGMKICFPMMEFTHQIVEQEHYTDKYYATSHKL